MREYEGPVVCRLFYPAINRDKKSELLEVRNHGNDMQHLVSSTDSLVYKAFTFMRNLLRWL